MRTRKQRIFKDVPLYTGPDTCRSDDGVIDTERLDFKIKWAIRLRDLFFWAGITLFLWLVFSSCDVQ